MDVDKEKARPGDVLSVTHYFRCETEATGEYAVFVHGEIDGQRVLVADHAPILGRLPTREWKANETWADTHRIKIPNDVAPGTLELLVGLFEGDRRLTVEAPPGGSDGKDRIRAGQLAIEVDGKIDDLPEAIIPRATSAIVADGVLDEAAWKNAPVLTFEDTMGRGVAVKYATRLRLLYDEQNLYVGFEADDEDVTEKYSKRDDPIYEHEAVEIYLMPGAIAPSVAPYIELQASPTGVIFDASFTGRRQGMDKSFNGGQTVATKVDGTLNQSSDVDRGWVSEWVVPWKSLRWVAAPPVAGAEWRMNAYRIEKNQKSGKPESEYTGWSPPRVGDFHNIVRFGRMKFGS